MSGYSDVTLNRNFWLRKFVTYQTESLKDSRWPTTSVTHLLDQIALFVDRLLSDHRLERGHFLPSTDTIFELGKPPLSIFFFLLYTRQTSWAVSTAFWPRQNAAIEGVENTFTFHLKREFLKNSFKLELPDRAFSNSTLWYVARNLACVYNCNKSETDGSGRTAT